MPRDQSETRFAVLIFTDIVGSTEAKARHGVPAYSAALRIHNNYFERLARECRGIHILQNIGDGYFAEAGSVAEAVRFALLFQNSMRAGPWGKIQLTTRVGIHAGEVATASAEGGTGIVAPAADLGARVMSLAAGGQILLTRFPFDEARHFLREHPDVAGRGAPPLRWLAHGPYLLKGCDESVDIFEVGAEGLAPLVPPKDSEKARRAIRPGEEETLGWRPAVGLEIPGRPGWRLTDKLGAGGFGEVWAGEHAKLHQRRAFKFCFDDERLRALKREVTLVRLLRSALGERDDIVRLHEIKLDEPPFYLESDLAPQGNLLRWAEKQGGLATIPLAQRIAIVAHTATALAAAHSIGVLHKDIKPSNILIFDGPAGTARPRLVDFGIGMLADLRVLDDHGVTAAGFTRGPLKHSTGTPTYSPPEYLAGKAYTVQGDIYGLGVLLYQLLTADSSRPLAHGWERDISDPLLCEDIAACVDGDPARRLTSAADLATRLLRLEERRTEILEKEQLAREAAARFEAETRELAERRRREESERHNLALQSLLAEAARSDRFVAEERLRAGQGPAAFAYLARACEHDPRVTLAAEKAVASLNTWDRVAPLMDLSGHRHFVTSALFSPDGRRIVTVSKDESAGIWDAVTGEVLAILVGHEGELTRAQFSPDSKLVVTASKDHTARVWDSATGQTLASLVGHESYVMSAQFSPDGMHIVTASSDKARIWDALRGKILVTLVGHENDLLGAQFSQDGKLIVTASNDHTARVWDASTGEMLAMLSGHHGGVMSAQFSRDSRRIVTASWDKTARVWDVATGRALSAFEGHGEPVWSAEFSPNGERVVTASAEETVRVWDASTGTTLATLVGHHGAVASARFSPDGTRVVTASEDRTARVWNAVIGQMTATNPDRRRSSRLMWTPAPGQLIATLVGHEGEVASAQFSPDGGRIVTGSWDNTARVWDAAQGKAVTTLIGHRKHVLGAEFSPDDKLIVTASIDETARVWHATNGRMLVTLVGHEGSICKAQFSLDGARIVTASKDETSRVWDVTTGRMLLALVGHERSISTAQFSPDGTRIVTASEDKTARVWDAGSGKTLTILAGHEKQVLSAEFSPDGTRVVTASADKTARIWDAANGLLIAAFAGHGNWLQSARFSPDGARIVTASSDKTARVWDAETGQMITALAGHVKWVGSARFSPNCAHIVTASEDETALVWNAVTGKPIARLAGHTGALTGARFSPDGTRIVTASDDATVRVWDAATGKLIATLTGHQGAVTEAQFGSDGTRIVSASADNTAFIWTVLSPRAGPPPGWFPNFLRYMAHMRLNPDGELEAINADDWVALRDELRGVIRVSSGQNTPYLDILRKYVREVP